MPCCNYVILSMQTVFVLLAVKLKEISDTKERMREAVASGLLKKGGEREGMLAISFGITVNAFSSTEAVCASLLTLCVGGLFVWFFFGGGGTKILSLLFFLLKCSLSLGFPNVAHHLEITP